MCTASHRPLPSNTWDHSWDHQHHVAPTQTTQMLHLHGAAFLQENAWGSISNGDGNITDAAKLPRQRGCYGVWKATSGRDCELAQLLQVCLETRSQLCHSRPECKSTSREDSWGYLPMDPGRQHGSRRNSCLLASCWPSTNPCKNSGSELEEGGGGSPLPVSSSISR